MILPIHIYGNSILRKVAHDIDRDYPELENFIADMWETLGQSTGIGLAATQTGKDIRVVVIDLNALADEFPEYKDFRKVYINGHITDYDNTQKTTLEEGCLSFPGLNETITRPARVRIKYCDEAFQEHDEWVEGYLARVIQHEFDHLDGIVFTDRLSPLRKQLVKGKLKALLQGRFKCSYKFKTKRV